MSAEDNDGEPKDSGLVTRGEWLGMPPLTFFFNLTEPAPQAPIDPEEPNPDQIAPAREVVLLGEEPRTFEG